MDRHNEGDLLKCEIVQFIERSQIIVADVTNERPNCYLETGYAMMETVRIKRAFGSANALPFGERATRSPRPLPSARCSWSQTDWVRQARRHPGSVQAVAPMLDLAGADDVWAPSKRVAHVLAEFGFDQVTVRRLRVAEGALIPS